VRIFPGFASYGQFGRCLIHGTVEQPRNFGDRMRIMVKIALVIRIKLIRLTAGGHACQNSHHATGYVASKTFNLSCATAGRKIPETSRTCTETHAIRAAAVLHVEILRSATRSHETDCAVASAQKKLDAYIPERARNQSFKTPPDCAPVCKGDRLSHQVLKIRGGCCPTTTAKRQSTQ